MTKRTKKLSLNKETVLDLQASSLANVRGGRIFIQNLVAQAATKAGCADLGDIANPQSEYPQTFIAG